MSNTYHSVKCCKTASYFTLPQNVILAVKHKKTLITSKLTGLDATKQPGAQTNEIDSYFMSKIPARSPFEAKILTSAMRRFAKKFSSLDSLS